MVESKTTLVYHVCINRSYIAWRYLTVESWRIFWQERLFWTGMRIRLILLGSGYTTTWEPKNQIRIQSASPKKKEGQEMDPTFTFRQLHILLRIYWKKVNIMRIFSVWAWQLDQVKKRVQILSPDFLYPYPRSVNLMTEAWVGSSSPLHVAPYICLSLKHVFLPSCLSVY